MGRVAPARSAFLVAQHRQHPLAGPPVLLQSESLLLRPDRIAGAQAGDAVGIADVVTARQQALLQCMDAVTAQAGIVGAQVPQLFA